jgi:hypothetical protein
LLNVDGNQWVRGLLTECVRRHQALVKLQAQMRVVKKKKVAKDADTEKHAK